MKKAPGGNPFSSGAFAFLLAFRMARMRADRLDGLGNLLDDLDLIFERHGLHARKNLALFRRRIMRRQMVQCENRDIAPALLASAAVRILVEHLIHLCEDDIFHKIFEFHPITPSIHCVRNKCMDVHIPYTNYNIVRSKKQVRQMIFPVV